MTNEMNDEARDTPKPPPEVEQAVLLGHINEAVQLCVRHMGIDEEAARALVERLREENA